MRIIASLPDLSAAEGAASIDTTSGVKTVTTVESSVRPQRPPADRSRPRRNRPPAGRFPGGSILVLSVIAAACWAAAWRSDGPRGAAAETGPGRVDGRAAGDVPDRIDRTETASP